jgi:hypothetical protein
MPRIEPIRYENASAEQRAAWNEGVRRYGRMTHMKRTLLHSLPAFKALMEWYTLRDVVKPFLGERLTVIFSHAISSETDCLICSTFFRRLLVESGEDPDNFTLDEREALVVEFGRCLARPFARVPEAVYRRLREHFTDEQIVALTAFGAMMVATNIVNNALEVELDGYLEPYRKAAESGAPGSEADA